MLTLNFEKLKKNLLNINYPITKKELVKYAEETGVDEQVLRVLTLLPAKQYKSLLDVSKHIGELTMDKISSDKLRKNLLKINYPITKKELVKYAEETGVDEQVLRALKTLPSKQYQTLDEVNQGINKRAS
ncbi:DUF2795 domain-containing protein [Anabaena subtropica]|uniref:DUF2795 domain-containing protein n=1 Tax=Anabaena subtropica FACHB-260 TaxID=2692884 RepID=A0ABR8CLN2_9NOST|nr:DUF2795 domain-containing protein [Anabaena subtropica]MBD2344147.1 DUF2795 domain-containing protein [Anabaena subtropica FACHB-260]